MKLERKQKSEGKEKIQFLSTHTVVLVSLATELIIVENVKPVKVANNANIEYASALVQRYLILLVILMTKQSNIITIISEKRSKTGNG